MTGLKGADLFLLSAADRTNASIDRALESLSALPDFAPDFDVQTSATTLDKDQSSLTALNVNGLLQLDSFYTFLMAAAATAMFVFGLLMQRRREYVTLRAQGLQVWEVRRLVLMESGLSAMVGAAIGMLVGVGVASQFVLVLRPIFTLPPPLAIPVPELAILAALVLGATVLSSAAAALRRLSNPPSCCEKNERLGYQAIAVPIGVTLVLLLLIRFRLRRLGRDEPAEVS